MKCSSLFLLFILLVVDFHSSTMLTEAESATLTLNGFARGESGGGASECDGRYHNDNTLIVALSTDWFKGMCGKKIAIHGNKHTVVATVVDECDQRRGCKGNIVDGSEEVWEKLGVPKGSDKWGEMPVTWNRA